MQPVAESLKVWLVQAGLSPFSSPPGWQGTSGLTGVVLFDLVFVVSFVS